MGYGPWGQAACNRPPTRLTFFRGDPRKLASSRGATSAKPVRVIADKGYDSDVLRERLARRGIELIAPHRSSRKKPAPRMMAGHCGATSGAGSSNAPTPGSANFHRLVVRHDRSLTIHHAVFHIACFMIVLRRVVQ